MASKILALRRRLGYIPLLAKPYWALRTARLRKTYAHIQGLVFEVDKRLEPTYSDFVVRGSYEPVTTDVFKRIAQESKGIVVDVGANIGYYSLLAAQKGREVYAYEPGPDNYAYLLRNIELNPRLIQLINPRKVACASSEGKAVLYLSHFGTGGHSLVKHHPSFKSVSVCQVTLDNQLLGLEKSVSLIKVDVEGAELSVLNGAWGILKRDHPAIIFEVCPPAMKAFGVTVTQLLGRLQQHHYSTFRLLNDQRSPLYTSLATIPLEMRIRAYTRDIAPAVNILAT